MEESDFMNAEIRYLGDLARLQLAPGDVLVLTCQRLLSEDQAARLHTQMKDVLGDMRVLVLSGGIQLGVVSAPRED